ncbi:MAG: hypothetical protein WA921_10065 [Ahrensia sp.]
MLLNTWWFWAAAGIAFGILEMVVPGYIFLGFAIGAIILAIALPVSTALGIAPVGVALLVLAFAIISLVAWFALRRIFGTHKGQVKIWTRDINDN